MLSTIVDGGNNWIPRERTRERTFDLPAASLCLCRSPLARRQLSGFAASVKSRTLSSLATSGESIMKVGEHCNRDAVTTKPDASLAEAAALMREKHVGFLIVVDEAEPWRRAPIGVLTDRDMVVQVFAPGVDVASLSVADVMTRDPVMASDQDDLGELLPRLREAGVRRAPVVDAHGGLAGVIAIDDAIELVTDLLCDISGVIRQGQRVERRHRAG